ncbi:hypothetical protein D0B54_17670 [Solimonas sp. K1W22B-7]|uniref:flagellar protein FlaG n=1 Tax=Solimonas sp. K1W22B-7 TaxID=2303331 RepID=UPI000E3349AD|nr:flagellar protein FlaG [Solimonas sp. K1W22B-7]AXQ30389.1 hypothetical protein D0B54_17670 [Solimonas sp. K1W22B-7]
MSNEISAVAAVAASSRGEGHRVAVSASPESSPVAAPASGAAAVPEPAAPAADLQEAISQIERYIQASRTGLEFRVDQQLNRVIVSIVDPRDGTVLRQMPSEEALRIARSLVDEGNGGLLDALV